MSLREELNTMVATGAVTSTSVRVWARGSQPGPHRLVIEPEVAAAIAVDIALSAGASDRTGAWTYPDDFLNAVPLAAMTAHSFRVVHRDAAVVGQGRFTTAPEPAHEPHRFTFAAMSCHQPFDDDGEVSERARRMLRVVHEALTVREARFILAMGDQIYADAPPSCSRSRRSTSTASGLPVATRS